MPILHPPVVCAKRIFLFSCFALFNAFCFAGGVADGENVKKKKSFKKGKAFWGWGTPRLRRSPLRCKPSWYDCINKWFNRGFRLRSICHFLEVGQFANV